MLVQTAELDGTILRESVHYISELDGNEIVVVYGIDVGAAFLTTNMKK